MFFIKLAVCGYQDIGASNDKSDLVIAITVVCQQRDATEGSDVVLDRAEGMIKPLGDFASLMALEKELHCLDAMGLPGSDVLLLSPRGNDQTFVAEVFDVADDGSGAAVEQPIGEVLVTEQSTLFASLATHPQDPRPAQAGHPLPGTNLQVFASGVEGEHHRDLLALFERLSWGLFGSDDQQLDLAHI
jgi:hypothetical protein